MKVLVLDDHERFRYEIVSILTRNGHAAESTASAIKAIPLVEGGSYDLVLADYNMPEHDGIWFVKNLKKPKHTKILLVTAHINRDIIDEMFKYGIVGYIIKPFDEGELLHHIQFHTQGNSVQAEN